MAFALVANTSARSVNTTSVTTSAIDTSGASLIVIHVADYGQVALQTLSDSKGNTWTGLTQQWAGGAFTSRGRLYYCASPVVGSGHTFTYSGVTASFPQICVAAFSGALTVSPFASENGATSSGDASVQTGSVTPPEDNCLIITGLCFSVAATASINLGFTITNQDTLVGGNNFGGAMAYQIQTTATARNPQWDLTATAEMAAPIAVFKPSVGGADRPALVGGRLVGRGLLRRGLVA